METTKIVETFKKQENREKGKKGKRNSVWDVYV